VKAIQIYDGNKYSDESHSKTAMDTFTDIRSILYKWKVSKSSAYIDPAYIIFEVAPGAIFRLVKVPQKVKYKFMKLAIPKIDKSKIWNSFKEIK
jgi:hypothetical protein